MTTVYLAGPINGCNDDEAHGWRQDFVASLPRLTFLDPMRRDYRGVEDQFAAQIVEADLADIDASDVVLAYCWQPSWGTAMEILYARTQRKTVIAVVPDGQNVSPWLRHYTIAVLPTLAAAQEWLGSWAARVEWDY